MTSKESWKPVHINDSHPGLLSDVHVGDKSVFETTNRVDYKTPEKPQQPRARRKEKLREFFWNEFAQKFFDQMDEKPWKNSKIGEDGTTYKEMFNIEGFKPIDYRTTVDKDLIDKYPLYSDPPITIYLEKLDKLKPKCVGMEPNKVFRRNSVFVKKWYDELE